jgi:oligoendopeptidase F
MAYQSRDEIDERYRWDLSSIYADDEAFLAALEEAKGCATKLAAYRGKISQSPEELLAYLQLSDEAGVELGKLVNYAQRKLDEDTRKATYQDYSAQVISVYTEVSSATSWFAPELLKLDDAQMEQFFVACPELELYRRALHMVFRQRGHILGDAEEELLARAQDMAMQPEHIFSLFSDADLTFEDAIDAQGETHPVTHGSYVPLMMSDDRVLRKSAYASLYAAYEQFRNTAAATLGAQAKQLKFYTDARKYPTALEYCLDQNEVPTEVYTNLISCVHEHLAPMHKYVELRKQVLGVDELHFYDLYVPIVEDVDMEFTYEEACDLILEALEPLGEGYLEIVREGLSKRWIDVYETPGKRSGAYSAGGYGMHPVILMNFQGQLDDVFTLIHEMGHSIHTYLSCKTQPSVYSDYVIFVAEVASTVNEALLTQHLLKTRTDPRERAYILNHFLEQFKGTLYRQTMFAEFELAFNEIAARGEGITAEALGEIYRELNASYYGPDIVVDDQIAVEWARIPHFYYQYYVYQYATGFSAAIALSNRILKEGASAVADYLGFLSGGSSKTPIELLKGAGVDMTTPEPTAQALAYFDELVDEFADAVR